MIALDGLKDKSDKDRMWKNLIFEAVVASAAVPLTLMLGHGTSRNIEIDKVAARGISA